MLVGSEGSVVVDFSCSVLDVERGVVEDAAVPIDSAGEPISVEVDKEETE